MVDQDGICPSLQERDISGPSSDSDQEMHGHAGVKISNHKIEKEWSALS